MAVVHVGGEEEMAEMEVPLHFVSVISVVWVGMVVPLTFLSPRSSVIVVVVIDGWCCGRDHAPHVPTLHLMIYELLII